MLLSQMAKATYKARQGLTVGVGQLVLRGKGNGSVEQEVHDGDTLNVDPVGNSEVRFLAVVPEEFVDLFVSKGWKATTA